MLNWLNLSAKIAFFLVAVYVSEPGDELVQI